MRVAVNTQEQEKRNVSQQRRMENHVYLENCCRETLIDLIIPPTCGRAKILHVHIRTAVSNIGSTPL